MKMGDDDVRIDSSSASE